MVLNTGVDLYGGCTVVRTPFGLGKQGCNGAAKNQIQKCGIISKVFLFCQSQAKADNSMPILQEMACLGF